MDDRFDDLRNSLSEAAGLNREEADARREDADRGLDIPIDIDKDRDDGRSAVLNEARNAIDRDGSDDKGLSHIVSTFAHLNK